MGCGVYGQSASHSPLGLLAGAGHVPMLEVPEEFNAEVLKFLDSTIPPGR